MKTVKLDGGKYTLVYDKTDSYHLRKYRKELGVERSRK